MRVARDLRGLRDRRDGSEISSSRVTPVAHVLLVSLQYTNDEADFLRILRLPFGRGKYGDQ
jgi:hypothetical protein